MAVEKATNKHGGSGWDLSKNSVNNSHCTAPIMALEINFKNIFQDFNQSKFIVYICVLIFALLFALRLDGTITWSYWVVFLPIWVWKILVIIGALVGSWVWWRNPQYRTEGDAYTQYKAMVISTGLHLLLLMFELLACDKLNSGRTHILWVLVFIPIVFMSIISIGICVWAVKHERTFELELFCSVNILQFLFLALRLDGFIRWNWVIVFIPIWIVMCVALIGVLYAIILAIILLKSQDINPEQRRTNVSSAIGYTFLVIPLLVFQVLLVYKEDGIEDYTYIAVTLPLFVSFFTLALMSFGAKPSNQWWFGLRKEFCPWLLGICPLLQEYGNISYKVQKTNPDPRDLQSESTEDIPTRRKEPSSSRKHRKGSPPDESMRQTLPALVIDVPD